MTTLADRIVITGMGTVSSYGTDDDALWSAIREGTCVNGLIGDSSVDSLRTVRVNRYVPSELLGKRGLQFMPASALYLLGSSVVAMRNAGFAEGCADQDRLGIVVASNFAGFRMSEEYDRITLTEGPRFVSPMEAPNTLANAPASYLAIRIQARAINTTISTGVCASLDALGYALTMLRKRNADVIVAGGTEEWNDSIRWQFQHAGVLPQGQYEKAGRPFDSSSSGVMPGEGSASVVLERYSDARARGANMLGEVVSWHSSFAPSGDMKSRARVMQRTMNHAMQYGGIKREDVGLVVSGASGIPELDQSEAQAIEELFASRPIPVCSIKGTIGEASGASGMLQLFATVRSIRHQVIPATARGTDSPEPHIGISRTSRAWQQTDSRVALLTASDGFGGMSALIVREVLE